MSAIIFTAAQLKPEWALGFNSSVEWIGEGSDSEKYFHWAKLVHTMVTTFHAIVAPLTMVALQGHFSRTC